MIQSLKVCLNQTCPLFSKYILENNKKLLLKELVIFYQLKVFEILNLLTAIQVLQSCFLRM